MFANSSASNINLKAKQPDVTSSTEEIKAAHHHGSQESQDHIQINSWTGL